MPDVRWAKYNDWSGPWVRGSCRYKPPTPKKATWWDVLCYAVAVPEGGAYDTFVAYDGTAVTAGMFQWTMTTGRLQTLIAPCRKIAPGTFDNTLGPLFESMGLELRGVTLYKNGKKLTDRTAIRDTFTPPGGQTPRRGANWEAAKKVALAFNAFFSDPELFAVQEKFFLDELIEESSFKRPKLGGKTIASILYPSGWGPANRPPRKPHDACRAMFWSFWQNAPRQAEKYLYQVNQAVRLEENPHSFTVRLSRKFARSTFGNWGLEKAKAKKRESRYSKIVRCVNELMGEGALARNP